MNDLIPVLLPLAILLLLRAWNSGAIQATIGKYTPKLPAWAQWIPPMALNVGATLVVWLIQGVSDATLTDTLAQGGTSGIVTIGLWHVAKRVIPVIAVDQVRKAAARSGLTILLILLLIGGSQSACSGSPQTLPTVCPLPSQYLAALPPPAAVASAVQAAQGVVEQAQEVVQDPDAAGVVLVAARVLDTVEPACPTLEAVAATDCAAKVAEARGLLAKADATREQVCAAVTLALIVAQLPDDPAAVAALREVCR